MVGTTGVSIADERQEGTCVTGEAQRNDLIEISAIDCFPLQSQGNE